MKKKAIVFLFIFLIFLSRELYHIDKVGFLCPIDYQGRPIPIRIDLAGNGEFGAERRGKRIHQGVDLLSEIGAPVRAALSGRIINAEFERGYGNYIEIEHKNHLKTLYAHLLKINVRKGQFVRQGEVIGLVGKTGNARGRDVLSHLHFEMYKDGEVVDPSEYLE